jgi:hypothetical protein
MKDGLIREHSNSKHIPCHLSAGDRVDSSRFLVHEIGPEQTGGVGAPIFFL